MAKKEGASEVVRGRGSENYRVSDGLEEIEPDAGERHLILAKVIEDVSDAMKKLLASGLNRRAVEVLVRDSVQGVGLLEIKLVLDALEGLKERYCR